ncbi:hypothetical protein SBA1_300028 [Candidatus Sulfotelmatobacter kueseliae]|uniref:Uncharacterized protein n=1 Tax=Candidatus Sulfotelmatobacter kueseliae TaxID=2042962 RepID=A0A2U3KLP4_9BACT|nr:hypothetical protein SBA1_300028 [Candidatus Sulfotelmatobacter kueseliae]
MQETPLHLRATVAWRIPCQLATTSTLITRQYAFLKHITANSGHRERSYNRREELLSNSGFFRTTCPPTARVTTPT